MSEVIHKAYKYLLMPNNKQIQLLNQSIGCVRFVGNKLLELNEQTYETVGKGMTTNDMVKHLPKLKEDYPFLKNTFSQSLQTSIRNLGTAYTRFFKGVSKKPVFRKKGRNDSMTFPQKFRIEQQESIVFLPKIGEMKYKNSRHIKGKIKSITVSKRAGRFYMSVLTEQTSVKKETEVKSPVGIDVGLKEFAVLSNGVVIPNPKFYRKYEQKLAQEQRKLAKKVKFSSNWIKQLQKVQKIHVKIANSRYDFLQKTSTELVKNHDFIAVEDLAISNMIRNHKLAKSIADVGWGMFIDMLQYKSTWHNGHVEKVDRFYPSTKTCSNCGCTKLMPLKLRTYVCENCETTLDRDYNASLNILKKGLEEYRHFIGFVTV